MGLCDPTSVQTTSGFVERQADIVLLVVRVTYQLLLLILYLKLGTSYDSELSVGGLGALETSSR